MILPVSVSVEPPKLKRWWISFILGLVTGAFLFTLFISLLASLLSTEYVPIYAKNKLSTPRGNLSFSVPLDVSYGSQGAYFIPVFIGQGSQTYADTLIDSGSPDTWFDMSLNFTVNSETFIGYPNQPYEIDYMQGNVYGNIGKDFVTIANFTWLQSLGVVNQGVVDVNGIIGISRGGCDSRNLCSVQNWPLKQSVLAFYYDTSNWNGIFMAGYIDESTYCADGTSLTFIPQVGDYYWTGSVGFSFNGVSVGGQVLALFDTGTTYFMVSPSLNETISNLIGVNTGCNTSSISLTIGRKQFTIPSSVLVISNDDGNCMLRLDVLPGGLDFDLIVGATFLVNFYTVFDIANNQIGFCPPKQGLFSSTRRLEEDNLDRLLHRRPSRIHHWHHHK